MPTFTIYKISDGRIHLHRYDHSKHTETLRTANLLSAVIIKPISVGSLPPVLRVAAVGGVGVMVASPAMMLFWVWQKAMVLLRRREFV